MVIVRNIIILTIFLLILSICMFIASCDDFFSPTIEIFNKIENPTTINQEQNENPTTIDQEQNENTEIINQF